RPSRRDRENLDGDRIERRGHRLAGGGVAVEHRVAADAGSAPARGAPRRPAGSVRPGPGSRQGDYAHAAGWTFPLDISPGTGRGQRDCLSNFRAWENRVSRRRLSPLRRQLQWSTTMFGRILCAAFLSALALTASAMSADVRKVPILLDT